MGYRLVRPVIWIMFKLFYGRIDVVGRERIPPKSPRLAAMVREP
jgi:1-acyl-sn-glycerol-3-phosphate acyltransferase